MSNDATAAGVAWRLAESRRSSAQSAAALAAAWRRSRLDRAA